MVRKVSRGQKTTPEKIYEIIASYAVTNNYKQTSRDTGVPVSTVKKIVDDHIEEPEFAKLCNETKEGFAESATNIIEKGLILLERRFNRAMMQEAELDMIIQEIAAKNSFQLNQQERNVLLTKLRGLQLYDVNAITKAIGILYDKRALAEGGSTDNVTVNIKLPEGIDEYAG